MKRALLLLRAANASRESKYLDFKGHLDVSSHGEWCEVIKDIVAIANSGGGIVLFGVGNDGTPTEYDAQPLRRFDPAKITDKLAQYTGRQFADFDIVEVRRAGGHVVPALLVDDAGVPMVFLKAGTYLHTNGKEKNAFHNGTIYVRHGAKSEPAVQDDIDTMIAREVAKQRKAWLHNVRKVVAASPDQDVVLVARSASGATAIGPSVGRIVNTSDAPGVYPMDADVTWPYRSKEILKRLNDALGVVPKLNLFDLQAIRGVYNLQKTRPDFVYRPFINASPQYSDAFLQWLVDQYKTDPHFFETTRHKFKTDGKI